MDFYRWVKCQWDRAAAVAAAVAGLVALLLGWLGVSRSGLPAQQIPYLASGAVLGLFALGVAATLWLSADLRDEWRKLDQIHRDLAGRPDGDANGAVMGELPAVAADHDTDRLEPYVAAPAEGRRERPLRAPVDVERRRGD
jgi:hypothetical protein